MDRISWGIILTGNPRYERKKSRLTTFFLIAFVVVPIVLTFITIVMLATGFSWGDFCLIPCIVFLSCGNILRIRTFHCPYCKHYLVMEDMGYEKYLGTTTEEISKSYNEYNTDTAMDSYGNVYFINTKTTHTQYGTKFTEHYAYNMVCRCCGCVAKYKRIKTYNRWH